jgi:hypothetical protein
VGLAFFALTRARALALCDDLDGPVVKAAQRALETRNPALVLIWYSTGVGETHLGRIGRGRPSSQPA